mmetsp:Transcript_9782/g.19051  ORF Transcript_9782/g.19051 Transcript_9782/m.19051 type:complete len:355 (+) Transcript_9782:135-1199(+)
MLDLRGELLRVLHIFRFGHGPAPGLHLLSARRLFLGARGDHRLVVRLGLRAHLLLAHLYREHVERVLLHLRLARAFLRLLELGQLGVGLHPLERARLVCGGALGEHLLHALLGRVLQRLPRVRLLELALAVLLLPLRHGERLLLELAHPDQVRLALRPHRRQVLVVLHAHLPAVLLVTPPPFLLLGALRHHLATDVEQDVGLIRTLLRRLATAHRVELAQLCLPLSADTRLLALLLNNFFLLLFLPRLYPLVLSLRPQPVRLLLAQRRRLLQAQLLVQSLLDLHLAQALSLLSLLHLPLVVRHVKQRNLGVLVHQHALPTGIAHGHARVHARTHLSCRLSSGLTSSHQQISRKP